MYKPSTWLIYLYSGIVELLWQLLRLIIFPLAQTPRQLLDRQLSPQEITILHNLRSEHERGVLWFCSSAGEYEQAKPLIDKLATDQRIWQIIIFFSRSGYEFAKARHENITFMMSPPDTIWRWRQLLTALRPNIAVIVRHELWPGFLHAAAEKSLLFLIDAIPSETRGAKIKSWLYRGMLNCFDWIALVHENDMPYLRTMYRNDVDVTGDTKYERSLQRTKPASTNIIDKLAVFVANKKILIGGSVWLPDVQVILGAFQLLPESLRDTWRVILAAHDVSETYLAKIEAVCRSKNLQCIRWSALHENQVADVLIIDVIGVLAELYAVGTLGFVGGAMDHKVHNVLEPACHGLFLAHGPCYTNSAEAKELVHRGLVTIVDNAETLAQWWQTNATHEKNANLIQHIHTHLGATNKIYTRIVSSLDLSPENSH